MPREGTGAIDTSTPCAPAAAAPTRSFGLLYGIGFGGFVDGIVLHQILRWHHMVSDVDDYPTTTVAGLEANTLADGFFHVATWLFLLTASVVAIRSWQQGRLAPSWRFHFGLVLAGWGIFNLVEGARAAQEQRADQQPPPAQHQPRDGPGERARVAEPAVHERSGRAPGSSDRSGTSGRAPRDR